MNRDELDGKAKQVKGKVKQSVGDLTDDEQLRDEGVADEAEGEVQETFGKARRKVGEAIKDIGEGDQEVSSPYFRGGLDPPRTLCYICKVLVGPGTPYLGPDSKTRQRFHVVCRIADARLIASDHEAQHHQPL